MRSHRREKNHDPMEKADKPINNRVGMNLTAQRAE
jgi:hypothetical protein